MICKRCGHDLRYHAGAADSGGPCVVPDCHCHDFVVDLASAYEDDALPTDVLPPDESGVRDPESFTRYMEALAARMQAMGAAPRPIWAVVRLLARRSLGLALAVLLGWYFMLAGQIFGAFGHRAPCESTRMAWADFYREAGAPTTLPTLCEWRDE